MSGTKEAEVLERLGLSEAEAEAYTVLIKSNVRTAEEVFAYIEKDRGEVLSALESLANKKYVVKVPGKRDPEHALYLAVNPQIAVTAKAEEKLRADLTALSNEVEETWKQGVGQLYSTTQSLYDETRKESDTLISEIKDSFQNKDEGFRSKSGKLKKAVADLLKEQQQLFAEMINTQYSDFKTKIEDTKNAFNETQDKETQDVLSKVEALESEISAIITQMKEERDQSIKEYTETIQTNIRPTAENLLASTGEARKGTSDTLNNAFSAVDSQQTVMRGRIDAQGKGAVDIVANRVDELGAVVKERGEKTYEEAENLLGQSVQITTKTLDNTSNSTVQALKNVEDKLKGNIDNGRITYQKTTETANKLKTTLTKTLTEGNNDLSLIDEHSKEVDSRLTEAIKEFTTTINDTKTQFEELLQKLEEVNESHLNQHQENLIERSVEGTKEHLENLRTGLSTSINAVYDTVKNNVEQSLQKFIDTMNRLKQVTSTNLETLTGSGEMLLGQLQTTLQGEASSFISDVLTEINSKVADFDSEKIPDLQNRIDGATERVSRKITDGLSQSKKVLSDTTIDNERTMNNGREEIKKNLDQDLTKYRDNITKILENMSKETERSNQVLRDNIPEEIEEFVGDHKQRMTDLNRGLHTDLADLMELISILDTEIHGDKKTRQYLKKLDFQKDKQDEFLDTLTRIRENVTQTKNMIDGLVGDYVTELDSNFDVFRDRFDKHVSENTRSVLKLLAEQMTNIGNFSKEVKDQTLEKTETSLKKIAEETVKRNEKINNELTDVETTLKNAVSDISDAQKNLADTLKYEVHQFEDSTKKTTEGRHKGFDEGVNNNIQTLQGAVSSIATQTADETNAQISDIQQTVEDLVVGIRTITEEKSGTSITQISDAVETHIENMNTIISETTGKAKSQLNASLQSERAKFVANIAEIVNKKIELFNSLSNQATSDVANRNDALKDTLSKRFATRQSEVNSAIDTDLKELDEYFNNNLQTTLGETVSLMTETSEKIVNAISLAKKDVDKVFDCLTGLRETISLIDTSILEAKSNAVADMNSSLDESKKISYEEISKQTEVIKREIQRHLGEVTQRFDNFDKQLTKTRETLDSNLEQLNQEHLKTLESQTDHFLRLIKTFTTKPGSALKDQAALSSTNLDEISSSKLITLREIMDQAISSIRAQLEKIETDYTSHVDEFVTSESKDFIELGDGIETRLNAITSDKQHKTEQTQEEIKIKIESSIGSIPDTVRGALEKAGDVMKFIGDVHDVAMKTPPKPIEHTYLVMGKKSVLDAISGAIQRTKSTIFVIIPKISEFPVDALEEASKAVRFARIRISIIAGIDNESMIGKLRKIKDNIDIRDYDSGTYGFFRDVPEEGGIGSEEGDATEFIITSSGELVSKLNEIYQNIFPRAKRV